MNIQTGEIKPWDSLTDEQQKSGEWIKLPTHDENGVQLARRDESFLLRQMFEPRTREQEEAELRRAFDLSRRIDALGKVV